MQVTFASEAEDDTAALVDAPMGISATAAASAAPTAAAAASAAVPAGLPPGLPPGSSPRSPTRAAAQWSHSRSQPAPPSPPHASAAAGVRPSHLRLLGCQWPGALLVYASCDTPFTCRAPLGH